MVGRVEDHERLYRLREYQALIESLRRSWWQRLRDDEALARLSAGDLMLEKLPKTQPNRLTAATTGPAGGEVARVHVGNWR